MSERWAWTWYFRLRFLGREGVKVEVGGRGDEDEVKKGPAAGLDREAGRLMK